jgi:cysteine-rich repeat protein
LGTCIATKCVSGTVLPGGTVTTDTQGNGATPTEPVQTAVTSPADGTITITETAATGTPPTGFALVGEQVTVSAPAATPDVPLILAFLIDASRIPAGADETTIQIFKDGVLVPACAGAPGVASPDPCVSDRQLLAGGDVQITVLTSTASVWTFAVSTCGNGVLDPGEQCDDGNTVDGDGCSASCLSELIPGIGTPKRECVHEWLALSVPRRDHKGRPIRHVSCTDNNPTCDFGAVSGECTFHIGQCFNVTERRFACSATDVARVRLLSPRENKPRSSIDEANRDALEASLAGVGGVVRGQCTRPLSKRGQLCTVNADCDSAAGRGNGRCRGRFVAFAPALSAADSCTSFADIRVPLGRTEKLLLNAAPSAGRSDLNVLHLRCKP